ncbi:hypothetical protein CDD83_2450 [Cordyceps sp. RAO-2017]|nr:hypothetical protein CDD83_2450 [Cordyceps sp. RAO-2017]
MAPRARRGEASEPQAFHELGVRGRKTGVYLPDGGERDEHGMQPLDAIFSSPSKTTEPIDAAADETGSEDMEILSSGGPGPRTVLQNQRNVQYPIPRSRSPLKTNLGSPARKNPYVERPSSTARRDDRDDPSVTRKLDFNARGGDRSRAHGRVNGVNGASEDDDDDDDSIVGVHLDPDVTDMAEESLQLSSALDGADDTHRDEPAARGAARATARSVAEKERLEEEAPAPRRRGRPRRDDRPKDDARSSSSLTTTKKRRSARRSSGGADETEPAPSRREEAEADDEPRQAKRQRTKAPVAPKVAPHAKAPPTPVVESEPEPDPESEPEDDEPEEEAEPEPERTPKPSRPAAKTVEAPRVAKPDDRPEPKGKRGRKPKQRAADGDGGAGEASFMALQRGPPMPRSRGLVSVRRDADAVTQTRSGRHSYRPIEYWRGEQVIREDEERSDMFHRGDFVLPTIKEVVRVPPEAPPSKRAPRAKAAGGKGKGKGKGRGRARDWQMEEEEDELEDWEVSPGTVEGEVVVWEPEHEEQPPADDEPVQVTDERIAIAADAIQTSDIKDASFRFAKTLTTPFMGAGVVDLPPGSEKRPKNSRRMHMVFFVHYGKVLVTINDAQFRISAGGTWFVPRGNYYSITNDYNLPARIFFAQGCEVQVARPDDSQMTFSQL